MDNSSHDQPLRIASKKFEEAVQSEQEEDDGLISADNGNGDENDEDLKEDYGSELQDHQCMDDNDAGKSPIDMPDVSFLSEQDDLRWDQTSMLSQAAQAEML